MWRRKASKRVWLTFDDGPHKACTNAILDVLGSHAIKAAFFFVGQNVEAEPGTAKRAFLEGHRIGNHSYSHRRLIGLGGDEITDEIRKASELMGEFEATPRIFRPPYGKTDPTVERVAAKLGYRTIRWNVDPLDWSQSHKPDRWVEHGAAQISERRDSVVILHDLQPTTADNLGAFISRIKDFGRVEFADPWDL